MTRSMREPMESVRGREPIIVGWLRRFTRDDAGALLVETVLAVVVFTLVGTAVMAGLSTAHSSGAGTERQSVAENIARNQMEYMFSLPYQDPPSSYPLISVPGGYAVTCTAETYGAGGLDTEKVVVTVTFNGAEELVLEALRAKR